MASSLVLTWEYRRHRIHVACPPPTLSTISDLSQHTKSRSKDFPVFPLGHTQSCLFSNWSTQTTSATISTEIIQLNGTGGSPWASHHSPPHRPFPANSICFWPLICQLASSARAERTTRKNHGPKPCTVAFTGAKALRTMYSRVANRPRHLWSASADGS